MTGNVEIIVQDTPEKFQCMAEELVPPLLELLRQRNELEREICARYFKLREEKAAAGMANQSAPADEALREEYSRRYMELVRPCCSEKMMKWGAVGSFGKPARYDGLFEAPEAKAVFTMKTAKKAIVETCWQQALKTCYRFTLRPGGDGWKVDGVDYSFGEKINWHSERHL